MGLRPIRSMSSEPTRLPRTAASNRCQHDHSHEKTRREPYSKTSRSESTTDLVHRTQDLHKTKAPVDYTINVCEVSGLERDSRNY